MGGVYGHPVSGELEFWTALKSNSREIVKQLTRIADALEKANARRSGPGDIRIGDRVRWRDPEGGYSEGWTVLAVPDYPGPYDACTIKNDDGTTTDVCVFELVLAMKEGEK